MQRLLICLIVAAWLLLPAGSGMGKEKQAMGELRISSHGFGNNGFIPRQYTCDGVGMSPPFTIENVPQDARSLALIVDDPDAPAGTWVHWVVWNIDPGTREIGENALPEGAEQGKNSWHRNSYGGPCPPSGSHRYFFKLYALNTSLALGADTTKAELENAMRGHIVAQSELIGLYKRK